MVRAASNLRKQWRRPTLGRGYLSAGFALFTIAILFGLAGPPSWGWMRVTLLTVSVFGLFVVTTVPDHFVPHHLWEHVIRGHVARIFGWTLGALAFMALLAHWVDAERLIRDRPQLMGGRPDCSASSPNRGHTSVLRAFRPRSSMHLQDGERTSFGRRTPLGPTRRR